jgi:hypothetical protein
VRFYLGPLHRFRHRRHCLNALVVTFAGCWLVCYCDPPDADAAVRRLGQNKQLPNLRIFNQSDDVADCDWSVSIHVHIATALTPPDCYRAVHISDGWPPQPSDFEVKLPKKLQSAFYGLRRLSALAG